MSGSVGALHDDIGAGQPVPDVAFVNHDGLEHAWRLLRVVDGFAEVVRDVHVCRPQRIAILVRQQQDGLGHMSHVAFHEIRLIVGDQRYDVAMPNVLVVNNGKARCVERQIDGSHATARDRGPNGASVEHSWKHQIVGVQRGARGLADPIFTRDAVTDRVAGRCRRELG